MPVIDVYVEPPDSVTEVNEEDPELPDEPLEPEDPLDPLPPEAPDKFTAHDVYVPLPVIVNTLTTMEPVVLL